MMLTSNPKARPACKQPATTNLKFITSNEEVLHNLDILKLKDYPRFVSVTDVGTLITQAINNESIQQLQALLDKHLVLVPFLKLYFDDAFVQALHLRYEPLIQFFLQNGYDVGLNCEEAVLSLCNSLEYLRMDPPVELLKLLLEYGASTSYCDQEESQTALHLAAKYGCLPFVRLLVEYGGDYDAVDNNKKTPLNYAVEEKNTEVSSYLQSLGAKSDWRY